MSLAQVGQVFRTMETTYEFVRPTRHWSPDNVRGHVFMRMLAYLVVWEARGKSAGQLERDRAGRCEGRSLHEIWEPLGEGVKTGIVRVGDEAARRLAPVGDHARELLAAAGKPIQAPGKRRFSVA